MSRYKIDVHERKFITFPATIHLEINLYEELVALAKRERLPLSRIGEKFIRDGLIAVRQTGLA